MNETKKTILLIVEDLVSGFVYYDRKECEQLSIDQLNDAVHSGLITKQEIIDEFAKHINNCWNDL
jgi:predicted RNA-binding protein associated with RNAse of E/G family